MGKLVNLLSSGVGLASEALANRKKSKSPASQPTDLDQAESSSAAAARSQAPLSDPSPRYIEVSDEHADNLVAQGKAEYADGKHARYSEDDHSAEELEEDEEYWELDEAARAAGPDTEEPPTLDEAAMIDEFMRNHPPPAYSEGAQFVRGKLPCPVIIPQRRPRDKKRGFVRAYAPVLADCGIDQATFLEFLKDFHQAAKASGYLSVVNAAGQVAGMVPSAIAMGVSIGVQVTVGVAMEVQRRSRTNSFLDRMNKEFFEPRGLYCLILTYKPDSSKDHEEIDITQTIATNTAEASSAIKKQMKNLRLSSGKTYGEIELPESAPLVFPDLDELASDPSAEGAKKQNKLKSSKKFVADYFDKRAQAQYAAEHPGSQLAKQEHSFANRWADPNSKANSGGLINFATGGLINPGSRIRTRRAARRGEEISPQTGRRQKRQGPVRRVLQKNVLYMMIVNLPSEEEIAAAKEALASHAA